MFDGATNSLRTRFGIYSNYNAHIIENTVSYRVTFAGCTRQTVKTFVARTYVQFVREIIKKVNQKLDRGYFIYFKMYA